MSEDALKPGLYLVATPIGNLGDITLRALDVLRSADRIACEDTRQTQKLLNHFQIDKPTESCHEFNEALRAATFVEAIRAGQRIAVVTDAGMPGISDPGTRLVQAAIAAGVLVVPIPGANAAVRRASGQRTAHGGVDFSGIFTGEGWGAADAAGGSIRRDGGDQANAGVLRGAASDSGDAGRCGGCVWPGASRSSGA